MFELLKKLWEIIDFNNKKIILYFILILIISSFAEILSIASIIPFLSVLVNSSQLFEIPFFNKFIIYLNIKKDSSLLLLFTSTFCFFIIFSSLIRWISLKYQLKLGMRIGIDISYLIYKKILFQKYENHIDYNSSDAISSISMKAGEITNKTIIPILNIINHLVIFSSILFVLFFINPYVTLIIVCVFLIIYIVIFLVIKNLLTKYGEIVSKKYSLLIQSIQEGIFSIKQVIIEKKQEHFLKNYKNADVPFRQASINIQLIGQTPRFIIEPIGIVVICFIALYLSLNYSNFSDLVPIIGAIALGGQRILPSIQSIYQSMSFIRGSKIILEDVLEILKRDIYKQSNKTKEKILFRDTITFKDVCFKFNNDKHFILNKLNLEIKKNSCVGIIGKTGVGKTTFIDLLMGIREPESGHIFVDNLKLDTNNTYNWFDLLAHVPQNNYLLDATIADNITFSEKRENIDQDKLKWAIKNSELNDFINDLDKGIYTRVGENGSKLSGGQKQRICIARALYRGAEILILDESTNALDNKIENNILQNIRKLNQDLTIIIISHRKSTLLYCDKVYEVLNGNMIEQKN